MYYAIVDEFDQVLGACHPDLDTAEAAIRQFGEDAGGVTVVELTSPLEDMSRIGDNPTRLTGRMWVYDFVHERFEEHAIDRRD